MLESEFSMKFGVDPGNLTRPMIGWVCVKGPMTLRTQPQQHFLDQLD
jgi:hypothetical protein